MVFKSLHVYAMWRFEEMRPLKFATLQLENDCKATEFRKKQIK